MARAGRPACVMVTRQWLIGEILQQYPQAASVLAEYGLYCFGCSLNVHESLEVGCYAHGLTDTEIVMIVKHINALINEMPVRSTALTLTKDAALAIKDFARIEQEIGKGLSVLANADGSFCMEFRERPTDEEKTFRNDEVPDVEIYATPVTLERIGGSTIDYRDGVFKLDVVQEVCSFEGGVRKV